MLTNKGLTRFSNTHPGRTTERERERKWKKTARLFAERQRKDRKNRWSKGDKGSGRETEMKSSFRVQNSFTNVRPCALRSFTLKMCIYVSCRRLLCFMFYSLIEFVKFCTLAFVQRAQMFILSCIVIAFDN